ncbi:MAG: DUF835 domain-containing protein [Candidatus Thermoplasmatota archaeon]|nr:DUF835 domain-containing protein [Candidatus Thermoplasmatota archaeon]
MKNIFVVEDEVMLQQLYSDLLSMRGYNILGVASNGEEAVDKYKGFDVRPDLVIMDHRMPGMGGLEAAQVIREFDPLANIIIISADDRAVWDSVKLGIASMRKPFSVTDLMTTLESSLPKGDPKIDVKESVPMPDYLKPRAMYLFEEEEGTSAIEHFRTLISNGYKGIIFTRKHPDTLLGTPWIKDIPTIWLSTAPTSNIPTISPGNIQKILIMLQSALVENTKLVVMVLGYEFIFTNVEFERVLNLVQVLGDRIAASESAFVIFSMDSSVIPDREAKLIKKEFKVVN